MSIIKDIMKIFNGSSWDEYHPKTDSSQVRHTHANNVVSDLETDLQGAYICIGYKVQTVSGFNIPANDYDYIVDVDADLLTGTEMFTTAPLNGTAGLIAETISFDQSRKTITFAPRNNSPDNVTNGYFCFVNTCYKRI